MINKNYKFHVSLSVDSYIDKKDATESIASTSLARKRGHTKKMSFRHEFLGTDEFSLRILEGHSYCGGIFEFSSDFTETFTTSKGGKYTTGPYYKDGSLKAQFKSDQYFSYGQVVSLDIDATRYNSPESFVSSLTLQPTFYYTSPSDSLDNRKFRLVFVIDTLLNKDGYELASKALHRMAEVDTGEKIKDCCGERWSQYFNGNSKATLWKTYNVLSPAEIKPYIDKYNIELSERPENEGLFSAELIKGMETLSYKDFMHFNSKKYTYFWSSFEWGDEEYRIFDPKKDVLLLFRWGDKFKDGEGRRKLIQKYAALRRIAKPLITPDELLFNLYIDREKHFNNSDGVLTLDVLKRKVELAFKKNLYELREEYKFILEKCPVRYLVNPKYRNRAHEIINRARKELRWNEIDRYYDRTKSLKDNLEKLNGLDIKIGKTALYNYCLNRGINTKADKEIERNRILELYNSSLSQNENIRVLEENGIYISRRKLMRIVESGSSSQKEETDDVFSLYICCSGNIIIPETEKMPNPFLDYIFA